MATTRGNTGEVWNSFDRRVQAKASNDVVAVEDDKGDDMLRGLGLSPNDPSFGKNLLERSGRQGYFGAPRRSNICAMAAE